MAKQQIVVSGGAGYWRGDRGLDLDRYVLSLVGRRRPRVCAIPTASGDSPEFLRGFYEILGPLCEPSHLPLLLPPLTDPEMLLANQDVIYVGGGNTANLLAVWRVHGLDTLLRSALDRGVILYGSSAGGICWFEAGVTDSFGFDGVLRPLRNGLGFLRGSHAPHYDDSGRQATYEELIKTGALPAGIAVDDFAAVHFVDGDVYRSVSALPGAAVYQVELGADGNVQKLRLPMSEIRSD